jgi:hypothetical protein
MYIYIYIYIYICVCVDSRYNFIIIVYRIVYDVRLLKYLLKRSWVRDLKMDIPLK